MLDRGKMQNPRKSWNMIETLMQNPCKSWNMIEAHRAKIHEATETESHPEDVTKPWSLEQNG